MKTIPLVALMLGATAAAQQPTFRSTGAVVRIDVGVTDDKGPVAHLRAEDFVLTDNGARQQIRVDETQDAPLDLVAVTQPIESLQRTSDQQGPRIAAGFSAMLLDIDDRDRLAVLVASAPPARLRPLSFGKPQIDLQAIDTGAYAATFDAITAALGEFLPSDRRRVLMAFTNGADFRSTVTLDALVDQTRRLGPAFVLVGSPTMIKQTVNVGARTDTGIAIGETATALVSGFVFPSALELLARRTGGITVDLGKGDPAALMKNAFAWMRTRYVLSYEPPAGKGWHTLAVRVNRKGAIGTARDGYFVE
jgi:VWFA-related protein